MAQLSSFSITGSLDWSATTENTSSAGYMWFDGTNFKYSTSVGAWSAGGSMITAKQAMGGAGTLNAGLVFGGVNPSSQAGTEEYNGSSWASGGNMINSGYNHSGGTGTQNAALSAFAVNSTEEYNGTSWTSGGNQIQARFNPVTTGTQNSGLIAGGRSNSGATVYTNTEEYNGTSWASGGALPTAMYAGSGWGTQNDSIYTNGCYVPSSLCYCTTLLYNGGTWSTLPASLSNARYRGSAAGSTSNSGLAAGGLSKCVTEIYDGSSWSAGNNMITGRQSAGYSGTSLSAFIAGGASPTQTGATEEYNQSITACTL